MLEKDLEKKLKAGVELKGGIALKLVAIGWAGLPDRLILMPGGKVYFIEMKAPGKALRKLQDVMRLKLLQMGFICYRIDTLEKVKTFLELL